jgi:hydrogenase maturation protein HypF
VVKVMGTDVVVLRRARGHAPLPVVSRHTLPATLAFGSDLKNAVGISRGRDIILSQHIGDLGTREALEALERVIRDLQQLFSWSPDRLAADLHPGYFSSRQAREYAAEHQLPLVYVQHHHAHLAACMVENDLEEEVLGVVWDGTGYGLDGTVWGGEFLLGSPAGFRRVAHLRTFSLVGGDRAVIEPRRAGLGILSEIYGSDLPRTCPTVRAFSADTLPMLLHALQHPTHRVRTSSAGRLFDGVASLVGLHHRTTFEGQAAMALEYTAAPPPHDPFPFALVRGPDAMDAMIVDWEPMIREIVDGGEVKNLAGRFHETLARMILAVAQEVGKDRVVLSGGVFQNLRLFTLTRRYLEEAGFGVFTHQRIPPNDGGLAAGQIMVAAAGGGIP